jgi:hypothetical protein
MHRQPIQHTRSGLRPLNPACDVLIMPTIEIDAFAALVFPRGIYCVGPESCIGVRLQLTERALSDHSREKGARAVCANP